MSKRPGQLEDEGRRDYTAFDFVQCSVTEAKDVIPKPWLTPWAVKLTAERAVQKYERLGVMIREDGPKDALKWLKNARYASSDDKADRGTVVHAALEAYLAGEPMTNERMEEELHARNVKRDLWRGTAGMVAGLMQFLTDEEPEIIWSERKVFSRTHGYAGTPDVVGRMRIDGVRLPMILDVKSSKSIYDDTAAQLVGYARADFLIDDDGNEAPLLPNGEVINHGVVVRPTAQGKYELAFFDLTDDVWELFKACVTVAAKAECVKDARRGPCTTPNRRNGMGSTDE